MFTTICWIALVSAVPSLACPPKCSRIDDIKAFLLSQRLAVDSVDISMEDVIMLNRTYEVSSNRIDHIFPLLTIKLARYDQRYFSRPHKVAKFTFNFTVHNLMIFIQSGGGKPTVIGNNIHPWNDMQHELGSRCGDWLQCRFSNYMKAGIVYALLNSGYFGEVCENA